MNLLIVHSRSGADHKPYHIPAIHDIVLSSTLPPLIINGERVMYLTAEIRRSLYSPSTSLRIENDQTRPGGRPLILRSSTPTHSRTRIYPTKRTNERARFPLAKLTGRETIGSPDTSDRGTGSAVPWSIYIRLNVTMNY